MLHGREAELEMITNVLHNARGGDGEALIVRGEPGAGMTALLDHVADAASDMRILRCAGSESEMRFPCAALHTMLASNADRLDTVPAAQLATLRSVFDLTPAAMPRTFRAGLVLLTHLTSLAEHAPVLCLIDDAQWMDEVSREALLFAGRRLRTESVALIIATKQDDEWCPVRGISELRLDGISEAAAAALLADRAGDLLPEVRDRIIAEGRGNPYALLQLSACLSEGMRAGALTPARLALRTRSSCGRLGPHFQRQLAEISPAARTALLAIAAEDRGRLTLGSRAAELLDSSLDDLAEAEQAQLIRVDADGASFRHPLLPALVYQRASVSDRLAAHRALAAACGEQGEIDRRAWHMAAGTARPDDKAAEEMDGVAVRATSRGWHIGAAAAYERAAALTADRPVRARRLVQAASAAADADRLLWAGILADQATPLTDEPGSLAHLAEVRAGIELGKGTSRSSGRLLLQGAPHVAGHAPATAARMLLDAAGHACLNADREAAQQAARLLTTLALPRPLQLVSPAALGIANILDGDYAGGIPVVRQALAVVRAGEELTVDLRLNAARWAHLVGDDDAMYDLASAIVADCRTKGLAGRLPHALHLLAKAELFLGQHRDAKASGDEAVRLSNESRHTMGRARRLRLVLSRLAAIEGDAQRCRELTRIDTACDSVVAAAWAASSLALLDLGYMRPETALARLDEIMTGPARHTMLAVYSIPDYVESAVSIGRPDLAREPFGRFADFAGNAGQPWARAVASRCRALLEADGEADDHFELAIEQHALGGRPFERARTGLLYGGRLRRARRPTVARLHLRSALTIFERIGAEPWAERTRTELRATGEPLSCPTLATELMTRLTPQELHVVRLAATGLSNREIAAQMCLSIRTVGYHLYKAYPKLGIARRAELIRLIRDNGSIGLVTDSAVSP